MADIHAGSAHTLMLNGIVDVSVSALSELKVGATAVQERKLLQIQNASNVHVFVGSQTAPGTAVTTTTLAKWGIKVPSGDVVWLPVSDKITVYAMAQSGAGKRLRIAEYS